VPYKMKVDQPNLAKGEKILIPGLGAFANGETHDITDEQAEGFRRYNMVLKDVLDDNGQRTGRVTEELGLSLTDANIYGVKVEQLNEPKTAPTKPQPNVKVTPNNPDNGGGE
jgi:hypothetical protein